MQQRDQFGFDHILSSNATQSFAVDRGRKESGNAKRQHEEEKQRKEKQEREMKRKEKEKKRADALRLLEIYSDAENGLRRPSEFVCKLKFFNTLPDVPSEAKFVDVGRSLEELGDYFQSSLELNHKYDLIVAPDLGLNIDMIDPDVYVFPDRPGRLAPEDEALLNTDVVKGGKKASVPWMRPSEIITANFDENMYNQSKQRKKADDSVPLNREIEQSELIKRNLEVVSLGFEEANDGSLPIHPINKNLTAVKVQPILPCKDFMSRPISHVLVEAEPAGSTFVDSDREEAVFFSFAGSGDLNALIRAVPKRDRSQMEQGEDDDLDELFGEAKQDNNNDANGVLYETKGVFALRAIKGDGIRGKFVLVTGEGHDTVGYFPLFSRIELHDLGQDVRTGVGSNVPKKHRVATRDETPADVALGEQFWNSHFQATVYEEDDEEEEGAEPAAATAVEGDEAAE